MDKIKLTRGMWLTRDSNGLWTLHRKEGSTDPKPLGDILEEFKQLSGKLSDMELPRSSLIYETFIPF